MDYKYFVEVYDYDWENQQETLRAVHAETCIDDCIKRIRAAPPLKYYRLYQGWLALDMMPKPKSWEG